MMKKVLLLCLGLLLLLCAIYETTTMKHYNEADDEESNNNNVCTNKHTHTDRQSSICSLFQDANSSDTFLHDDGKLYCHTLKWKCTAIPFLCRCHRTHVPESQYFPHFGHRCGGEIKE